MTTIDSVFLTTELINFNRKETKRNMNPTTFVEEILHVRPTLFDLTWYKKQNFDNVKKILVKQDRRRN